MIVVGTALLRGVEVGADAEASDILKDRISRILIKSTSIFGILLNYIFFNDK